MTRGAPVRLGPLALACAAVCVATLSVYAKLPAFDFINYDDPYFIELNPNVTGGLTANSLAWAFSTSKMGIWHPLTWISYQLEISLFGPDIPGVHHTVNLVLHLANSLLVLLLCWRLTGAVWASMVVAILFSIHPQHVQPVAWISERKEVLAAFFMFVSLNLYVGYRTRPEKRVLYALSLAAFGLGLMSKPSVAPLPLVLVLIDIFFDPAAGQRMSTPSPGAAWDSVKSGLREKVPFLLVSLAVSAIAVYVKKSGHWAEYEETLHLARRMVLMPIGMVHYLKMLLVPWPNPLWIEAPEGLPYVRSVTSAAVLLLLATGIWRVRRLAPELAFGALWFVIMWLPVSGIVIVSNFYVADRYTYLPFVGALLGLVFLARGLLNGVPAGRGAAIALSASVIGACAVLSHEQAGYWRDSATFFQREFEINPDSATAPVFVGHALLQKGEFEKALPMIEAGLEMDDDQPNGHAFRARALSKLGRTDDAIEAYRAALDHGYSESDGYAHLGALLAERGVLGEAVDLLETGLELFPKDIYLLNNLAYSYAYRMERGEDALPLYERALRQDPDNLDTLLGLGTLQLRDGDKAAGMRMLERVLEIDPDNEPAREMIRAYGAR